jgi:hypothetical protein
MRQLTERELTTIANCARVAMERFEENAKELREAPAHESMRATHDNLARTFDKQAAEAKAIAELFDTVPPVVIGTCEACTEAKPEHTARDCPDRRLLALINQ